jgi:phospholipase C
VNSIESMYEKLLSKVFSAANPIKKAIIKTQCKVHKHININALKILANDKHISEYYFFSDYISDINEGAVWVDQDFKSSNHFYNPFKKKGLYGRKSAMDLGIEYYDKSLELWKQGEYNESLFYLGATLHIIQDMTIPQHANIRLLDNHRQYENYILQSYEYMDDWEVENGAYLLDSVENYIRFNTRVAIRIYKEFKDIDDDEKRYYCIARCGLPLAKRTTAGAMIMFYSDIIKI